MASVEIMVVLPADLASDRLRSEGRRFGRHKAAHAEQVMQQAHESGMLTDAVVDEVLRAVDHDIRKTVSNLAAQVPAEKLAIFDKAARAAYRRYAKDRTAK